MQTEKYKNLYLVKVPEARRRTGTSHTKFYSLVKDGKIAIVKIGRSTRVRSDELERFILSLTDKAD
jgi:excisionase family DNA binding protein